MPDVSIAAPTVPVPHRVSLRARIFLIAGAALLLMIGGLYALCSTILMDGFAELEREFATQSMERLQRTLTSEADSLQRKVADWATWDDTYEFMENPTEEYLQSNVGAFTAFHDLDVNFIIYVHPTGRIVFQQGYSRQTESEIPVPETLLAALQTTRGLLNHPDAESHAQGILHLPDDLLLVASRPITRTDRSGPIRGTLIFARFLDERQIARLADLTRAEVGIHPLGAINLPADVAEAAVHLTLAAHVRISSLNEVTLATYGIYADIAGRPTLVLRLQSGRSIHAQGLLTVRYLVLSLAVGGLVLTVLGVVLLDRMVLSRLSRMAGDVSAVGAGGDISARVGVEGNDELSALAETINSTLAALGRSQDQVRESERRLALVLDATTEGVWDWSVRTGECFYSPHWINSLGYRPEEIAPRIESWQNLLHPDDLPRVQETLRQHLDGNTPRYECEHRLRTKSGRWRWHSDRGKVVERDAEGRPLRMVGSERDISEQRHLEQQFQQAQKMEAVGKLAGGIAHDFNNLLTIVLGHSELLLLDFPEDSEAGESTREIRDAAEKAAALTQQLLAFSRSQPIQTRVLDLRKVVSDIESMLCRLIGEDILLKIVCGETPAPVRADSAQIEQILMNMALNARDAMPSGGQLVIEVSEVTLVEFRESGPPPGSYILLSVTDTGVGMTEPIRARIFEPFFTTKPPGKGSGLGLASCYGIVKQSNGHLTVESEPGRGSTFRIHLPRVSELVEATEEPKPAGNLASGSETVLLVEDEPGVRKLGAGILRNLGYTVLEAVDGRDAQRVVRETGDKPIDLVLTDVVMPNMGGKELADWLEGVQPDMRVLYCSGYTSDAFLRQGMIDQPANLLEKPFNPEALARKVREVLDEPAPTAG